MADLNAYINFNVNTEEVFNSYKSVFGGEVTLNRRFKDAPSVAPSTPGEENKIIHVALQATFGNNFIISINAEKVKPKLTNYIKPSLMEVNR